MWPLITSFFARYTILYQVPPITNISKLSARGVKSSIWKIWHQTKLHWTSVVNLLEVSQVYFFLPLVTFTLDMPKRLERMFSITATVITASAVQYPSQEEVVDNNVYHTCIRNALIYRVSGLGKDLRNRFKSYNKKRAPKQIKSVLEFWYKIIEGAYLRQKLIEMKCVCYAVWVTIKADFGRSLRHIKVWFAE